VIDIIFVYSHALLAMVQRWATNTSFLGKSL